MNIIQTGGHARWRGFAGLAVRLAVAGLLVFTLVGCGSNEDESKGDAANGLANAATIRERIIGNTVAGTMSPDSTYTEFYAKDGTIRGAGYTAKWTVDGDRMCFNYDEAEQADCYGVKISGNAVEWRREGETQGKGTIVTGNPNNF